jgi:hypothetical protein
MYEYWDVSYQSHGDGIITYTWKLNHFRYKEHLAQMANIGTSLAAGACLGFVAGWFGGRFVKDYIYY